MLPSTGWPVVASRLALYSGDVLSVLAAAIGVHLLLTSIESDSLLWAGVGGLVVVLALVLLALRESRA